jgi:enterochelin esterase family protein
MDVGLYDLSGLLDTNRRMQQMLTEKGYSLTYREYPAGHNYPAWADDVWHGLVALFGAGK